MPPETFFQYLDESGALVVVDRLEKVPEGLRDRAKKLELPREEAKAVKDALETLERLQEGLGGKVSGLPGRVESLARDQALEPVSFGLGFLAATLLGVGLWVLRGSVRIAFKLALLVLLAGAAGGLYFGWLRQAAGLSAGAWSHPEELLDEAKKARDRLDERHDSTEKGLEVMTP